MPLTADQKRELALLANDIRQDAIRMTRAADSGHPGGPLGLADIYSVLFKRVMRWEPKNPALAERDRFVLSNGHVCAGYYSVLARCGAFDTAELLSFRKLGSRLHGHPSPTYFPWAENAGGSLGQGLSFSVGTAVAAALDKASWRVFTCISDGECQEGMTWEAAMAAAHFAKQGRLGKIVAFVDRNDIQIDGKTTEVMDVGDLRARFEAFGWAARDASGHDFDDIADVFDWALGVKDKPSIVVFKTVLGKGVSYMENNPKWHGSPPSKDDAEKALAELNAWRASIEAGKLYR